MNVDMMVADMKVPAT